ncbi:hypothetical protein [Anaerovibrio slackiae]|uniref:AbrB/MazE/SpoVT family DNA-binding domain-containing protein n=1 Tax=Anaerovibrio slackiae TaxID=2652309 RepID=UPI00386DF43F
MEIAIENFGKGHVSRLSRAIMVQAGSSLDDKVSMNVEPECSTLQKIHAFKADRFMDLFGDYQGEWKGNEIDTDCAVGKEVLE